MEYDEKRSFMRVDVDCDMNYRLVDSSEFLLARCTSLSGSGISFVTRQEFAEGKALEINITPQNSVTPTLTAFVEVIRVLQLPSGEYEVATTIKTIKG